MLCLFAAGNDASRFTDDPLSPTSLKRDFSDNTD